MFVQYAVPTGFSRTPQNHINSIKKRITKYLVRQPYLLKTQNKEILKETISVFLKDLVLKGELKASFVNENKLLIQKTVTKAIDTAIQRVNEKLPNSDLLLFSAATLLTIAISGRYGFNQAQQYMQRVGNRSRVQEVALVHNMPLRAETKYVFADEEPVDASYGDFNSGELIDYKLHKHRIQEGESLYSIARDYEMTLEDLAELNSIEVPNRFTIYTGNEIKVLIER